MMIRRRCTPSRSALTATTMTCLSYLAAAFVTKGAAMLPGVSSFVVQNQASSTMASAAFRCLGRSSRRPFASFLSATASTEADTNTTPGAVPITLLSGFLGSGKTSTLQHLLENRDGLRIGVIVNDMASVNIDSKLVKSSEADDRHGNGDVVELQNGCACCSLADELLTTVETLLDSRNNINGNDSAFDAVVVELSGVADPIAIQQNWKAAKASGHPVTQKADMKRVVTLIDSSTFGTDWMTWDVAGERDGWVDPDDDCAKGRKIPELLAEQVEAADVLLLNKIDLAGPKQVEVATALARSINDKAVLEQVEFGKVASPKQIVRDEPAPKIANDNNESSESKSSCCSDPGCPSHSKPSPEAECSSAPTKRSTVSTDDLGIVSFVYRANRPFESRNLMGLLNTWPVPIKEDLGGLEHFAPDADDRDGAEDIGRVSPFFGVLRSKGFCWMAPTKWKTDGSGDPWRHDTAMYWSHAGKHFGISVAGKWWATIAPDQMKTFFKDDATEYDRIQKQDFVSGEWGDRRQELVFIGANIDQEKITKALDECLLGEKGMERYSEQVETYKKTIPNN